MIGAKEVVMGTTEGEPLPNNNPKKDTTKLWWKPAWNGYTADYKLDEDLQSLDKKFQTCTKSIISSMKHGDLSYNFLKEVIKCVSNLNVSTVKAILGCSKDIGKQKIGRRKRKDEDRYKLVVQEYLDNSLQMLEFCSELEKFLMSARDSHSYIEQVIQQIEKEIEKEEIDHESCMNTILETSKKLKAYAAINDHATNTERLLKMIQGLQAQQNQTLNNLGLQQEKVSKKQGTTWKKLANRILIGTAMSLFVFTVVKAALVDPTLAGVMAASISPAIVTGIHWMDSLLEEYDNAINSRPVGTLTAKKDLLDDIKMHADELETHVNSILRTENFAIEGQVETFPEKIKEFEACTQRCRTNIIEASNAAQKWKAEILEARNEILNSIRA